MNPATAEFIRWFNGGGHVQPFLFATLMMALFGCISLLLLYVRPVHSWRIRFWLALAVLAQGLMVTRAPVHLGWIESEPIVAAVPVSTEALAPTTDAASVRPSESATTTVPSLNESTADHGSTWPTAWSDRTWSQWFVPTLIGLWCVVAAGIASRAGFQYLRLVRLIARLKPASEAWTHAWRTLETTPRARRAIQRSEMLVSESAGPMLVRRPRGYALIVPRDYWAGLSHAQRRGVMLHEVAHVERCDVWLQLLARSVATLHWFNPLAWWSLRQFELAAECACDQRVLRHGQPAAAGFASALVQLATAVSRSDGSSNRLPIRGVGLQSMASPPLAFRISRLLNPNQVKDSAVKRIALALLACSMLGVSVVQVRLTTAQESGVQESVDSESDAAVPKINVLDDKATQKLRKITSTLDLQDAATARLSELLDTPEGLTAFAAYVQSLAQRSQVEARSHAIERYFEEQFTRNSQGRFEAIPEHHETYRGWTRRAQTLQQNIEKISATMAGIGARLDDSTEAGGLFKRLMNDPQAPVSVLMNEMQGGDIVDRFLSQALRELLVEQEDQTFIVVESRRPQIAEQVERLERASQFVVRLRRELPRLASEYTTRDDRHRKLVKYLQDPLTAVVVSAELSNRISTSAEAVDHVYEHFEGSSTDTVDGLALANDDAWEGIEGVFKAVDRAKHAFPIVRQRLAEFAKRLSTDDELTRRMAGQLNQDTLAVVWSAEIPYVDYDPGRELEGLIGRVMAESGDKLVITAEHEDDVEAKARELLQICRQVRRRCGEIEIMLDQVDAPEFVKELGPAGHYVLLLEIRKFADRFRPDPFGLLVEDLFVRTESDRLQVQPGRRELLRSLADQADRIRSEAENDDF